MIPQQPQNTSRRPRRRWAVGVTSALAAGALLAGGGTAVALGEPGAQPAAAGADLAAVVAPAAAATPSPSASGGARASSSAKHPARAALRRALAVVIRQDGTPQYGEHAQAAARAVINRSAGAFRHLPEKLRQDLWTLAGAAAGQETADAQAVKQRALDGTYGPEVQKAAQAIQKAPAKAAPAAPSAPATPTPAPSQSSGS